VPRKLKQKVCPSFLLKSKEVKRTKNGSKKRTYRRQSIRYRSWWKQDNIKMKVSEDHALCWVHKDLTVTTKQMWASLTATRVSGGKDECYVQPTGIERKYWTGTEIGRLGKNLPPYKPTFLHSYIHTPLHPYNPTLQPLLYPILTYYPHMCNEN